MSTPPTATRRDLTHLLTEEDVAKRLGTTVDSVRWMRRKGRVRFIRIAGIAQLTTSDHSFKTLVIDTADWLEKRLTEAVCRKANKESIEDFGYGKGYVILAEEFAKFLTSLDALLRRGMHVVLLAHSTVRKFESPDQAGSYDRFELKLSKQVAPLLKEWADLILFANYVTKVAENESGKKRGVGGRERVLFTTHAAAYDAKNRHGLEEKLPFAFDSIARVFGAAPATPPAKSADAPVPEKSTAERLADLFKGREEVIKTFLIARGQMKADDDWASIPAEYVARVLPHSPPHAPLVTQLHCVTHLSSKLRFATVDCRTNHRQCKNRASLFCRARLESLEANGACKAFEAQLRGWARDAVQLRHENKKCR